MKIEEFNNLKVGDWVVRQNSGILRQVTSIVRYNNTMSIGGKHSSYLQFFPINGNYFKKQLQKLADRVNYEIVSFKYNEDTKELIVKMKPFNTWKGLRQ